MGPGRSLHGFWGVLRGPALSCVQQCCWMLLSCPVPLHPKDPACAPFHSPCGFPSPALQAMLTSPGLALTDQEGSAVVARQQQQLLRFLPTHALIQPPAQQRAVAELMHLLSHGWGQRQGQAAPRKCPWAVWHRDSGMGHWDWDTVVTSPSSALMPAMGLEAQVQQLRFVLGTTQEFGVSRLSPPRVALG